MTTHYLHLEPRDLLFLRDARPMEASDAGLGANLPRPDQVWNGLLNAFHREWPQLQSWEHLHTKKNGENPDSSCRFGALQTAGPFPVKTTGQESRKTVYFPCPLDLSADRDGFLHPMHLQPGQGTNLPKPLACSFSSSHLGKQEPPPWISLDDYLLYLQNKPFKPSGKPEELFDTERQIGIGIDPDSHATREGAFYQAEYLRLRENVCLAVIASCDIVGSDRRETFDVLDEFLCSGSPLILGGQQGLAFLNRTDAIPLPSSPAIEPEAYGKPVRLRWTLLSPAVFPWIDGPDGVKEHPGGWLPNWIDAGSGQVMLPRNQPQRKPGEGREQWRMRICEAERFSARLIAARIGKPLPFSGWDLQTGPKPTQLAVPAGSVYLFECADGKEAEELSQALSWNGNRGPLVKNRRSTLFGEKGFGIGVCSQLAKTEEQKDGNSGR